MRKGDLIKLCKHIPIKNNWDILTKALKKKINKKVDKNENLKKK